MRYLFEETLSQKKTENHSLHCLDGITHRGCTHLKSNFEWSIICDKSNDCVKCFKEKCNGNSPQEEVKVEKKRPSKKVHFDDDDYIDEIKDEMNLINNGMFSSEELRSLVENEVRPITFEGDLSTESVEKVETHNQRTCIACHSAVDSACKLNATFTKFENCPEPYKCYHYINANTGEHQRGSHSFVQIYIYFIYILSNSK